MGWENYHLHRFQIHGREYGEGGGSTPGENIQLAAFDFRVNEIFYYQYDFGDRWEHEIRVEKLLEGNSTKTYPVCIGGNRACPPEDCGGPWGYMELLRRLIDPLDPRRRELMEWVGAGFDPARFHRRPVNRQLGCSYYQAGM